MTRAVLFDLDGTCIDTETISTKAIQLALDPFDKHIDWTLKKKLLGLRGVDWATIVVEEHGIQSQLSPEALVRQWEANLKALYAEAHLLPGVQRLVEHLHKHQVPMAICTSSSAAAVAAKRQHHEAFFSYFPVIVTGDDPAVTRGKPAPDIFLVGAQRLCPDRSVKEFIVFEDAQSGVAAAVAAGMDCVAVPDTRLDQTLFAAATETLASMDLFQPDKYGLPAF